jgi:hypothetical protein
MEALLRRRSPLENEITAVLLVGITPLLSTKSSFQVITGRTLAVLHQRPQASTDSRIRAAGKFAGKTSASNFYP